MNSSRWPQAPVHVCLLDLIHVGDDTRTAHGDPSQAYMHAHVAYNSSILATAVLCSYYLLVARY